MDENHDGIEFVNLWFDELFTRGNIEAVDDLVTPDFASRDPSGKGGEGGPGEFKKWLQWYLATFTDAVWNIHDVIVSADRIVVRYSGKTTYRGGWLGIPALDQRVTEMGIIIFRMRDGRACELWSALSDLEVFLALGGEQFLKKG